MLCWVECPFQSKSLHGTYSFLTHYNQRPKFSEDFFSNIILVFFPGLVWTSIRCRRRTILSHTFPLDKKVLLPLFFSGPRPPLFLSSKRPVCQYYNRVFRNFIKFRFCLLLDIIWHFFPVVFLNHPVLVAGTPLRFHKNLLLRAQFSPHTTSISHI